MHGVWGFQVEVSSTWDQEQYNQPWVLNKLCSFNRLTARVWWGILKYLQIGQCQRLVVIIQYNPVIQLLKDNTNLNILLYRIGGLWCILLDSFFNILPLLDVSALYWASSAYSSNTAMAMIYDFFYFSRICRSHNLYLQSTYVPSGVALSENRS